jgi:hypothetical protein
MKTIFFFISFFLLIHAKAQVFAPPTPAPKTVTIGRITSNNKTIIEYYYYFETINAATTTQSKDTTFALRFLDSSRYTTVEFNASKITSDSFYNCVKNEFFSSYRDGYLPPAITLQLNYGDLLEIKPVNDPGNLSSPACELTARNASILLTEEQIEQLFAKKK